MVSTQRSALEGLRVLDLAGLAGQYATRLLADYGADVIKIEPPEGDPVRGMSPFAGDIVDPDRSLSFLHYNTNKRSAVVDITTSVGRETFLKLVRTADVVIESFQPSYLDDLGLGHEALSAVNPGIVLTSVTPFGQTGPFSGYRGTDLHAAAMGGWMMIQGDPDAPPCMAPADQAYVFASVHAAAATMYALSARDAIGRGQHVDVSMQETIATTFFLVVRYSFTGEIEHRRGTYSQGGISGIYPAKDGWVCLAPIQPNQWKPLMDWMANPIFEDPVWVERETRVENSEFIDEMVSQFTSNFTVNDFVEQAQARRIPCGPVLTPAQFADNDNFAAREFMVEVEHPVVGTYTTAGAPFLMSATPWRITRPAPLLGQHTEEVLKEADTLPPAAPSPTSGDGAAPGLPMDGTRIVDLTRVWVGPYAVRNLADFGAEVIKIESSLFDTNRRTGLVPMTPDLNRNKYGITLDLHRPEAQEMVKRLVGVGDVIVDNYAPSAMERFGFSYEVLREIKPDIIQLRMPGWGLTGPYRDRVAFGNQLISNSGLNYLWGHDAENVAAHAKFAYPDFLVGIISTFALSVGLYHKKRTGEGQFIEVAQTEAIAHATGAMLLEYSVNGRDVAPKGNQHHDYAPHDVYPCKGDDQWCAIACQTDEEFRALAGAMKRQDWLDDPNLATAEGRRQAQQELNVGIAEWTAAETPRQVMYVLQKAGVAAAAVQTNEDIFNDYHLRARGFIVRQDHPEWGEVEHAGIPVKLGETPGSIRLHSPALGEHNDRVFRTLLGLSDDQVQELQKSKALV
jgi:crotonobetainyl-CoA:carnitine CoA-transferase CaiB-like acyl-CoA transferase